MSAAPLHTRALPSLRQEVALSDQQKYEVEQNLLKVLRPPAWENQTCNTLKSPVCLDMATEMMMLAIAFFDEKLAVERSHGKRVPGAFVSAIGVPDFEVQEHQEQIITNFRQHLKKDLEDAPIDRLKWSQDFGFRFLSMCAIGVEIPIDLGRYWLTLDAEDLKLLLYWTRQHCAPVLSWKRTDKGEEGMTRRTKIEERFLAAQRLKDLSKRVK